jgi:nucleoside-diphosphate-sugar epimerase
MTEDLLNADSENIAAREAVQVRGARVLVTGGCGMVGSVLCRRLCELGATPVALDNLTAYEFDAPARFGVTELPVAIVHGDVTDDSLVAEVAAGADLIIHAAAYADVAGCIANFDEDFRTNVWGTHSVLKAALRVKPQRFVFVSSASLYGHPNDGRSRFAEGAPQRPLSTYANSKLWGEHQTRLFHELYGLATASVRLFSVYGPPQVPKYGSHSWCIAVFAMQAMTGRPITIYGTGAQVRDFTHVEDIVTGILLAATSHAAVGRTFNVGTGRPTSVIDAARLVRNAAREVPTDFLPRPAGDPDGGAADTTSLRELLGWTPTITLEEGIRSYVDWLDDNRDLVPDWLVEDLEPVAKRAG